MKRDHPTNAALPSRQRVAIIGHLCAGNVGDEMMMRGLISDLVDDKIEVIVLRSRSIDWCDPRDWRGVRFVHRMGWGRLKLVRVPLLLCGGTHFHDDDAGVSRLRYSAAVVLLSAQLMLHRLSGGTYHLVGIGVTPLKSFVLGRVVRRVIASASTVTVRDGASKRAIGEMCSREVPLIDDLACGCPELRDRVGSNHERSGGVLVIPVSDPHDRTLTQPSATEIEQLRTVYPRVSVMSINGTARNLLATGRLCADCGVSNMTPPAGRDPIDHVLDTILDHDLVISARFHGTLASDVLGVPVIAWPYHPKVAEYARERGIPIWTCPGSIEALHQQAEQASRRERPPIDRRHLVEQIQLVLK